MAGTGPEDLHGWAVELLDASSEALDTIPTYNAELDGAPERAFVSPGLPALDCCPQLTVHVQSVSDRFAPPKGDPKLNMPLLVVTIVRCVPVPDGKNLPSPDAMQAVAEQTNADGWALWNHLFNLNAVGLLLPACSHIAFEGMQSMDSSGGCGGWFLNLRIQLDGYQEELGS